MRVSEDMLAREANFDAPGAAGMPFLYRSASPTPEKQPIDDETGGFITAEQLAEDARYAAIYKKQVPLTEPETWNFNNSLLFVP